MSAIIFWTIEIILCSIIYGLSTYGMLDIIKYFKYNKKTWNILSWIPVINTIYFMIIVIIASIFAKKLI